MDESNRRKMFAWESIGSKTAFILLWQISIFVSLKKYYCSLSYDLSSRGKGRRIKNLVSCHQNMTGTTLKCRWWICIKSPEIILARSLPVLTSSYEHFWSKPRDYHPIRHQNLLFCRKSSFNGRHWQLANTRQIKSHKCPTNTLFACTFECTKPLHPLIKTN